MFEARVRLSSERMNERGRERERKKERKAASFLYSDATHRSATLTHAYIQEKENKIEHTR